jgi:hypothetical protein
MDYQVVFNNNGVKTNANNAEFIANDTETTWWWTDDVLPIEKQDPWICKCLFINGTVANLEPWQRQVRTINQLGRKDLLENFLLFPYVYQSVQKVRKFFYPATVWYPRNWVSNGQHKLAVWDMLDRSFDFPILWQAPVGTEIVNGVRLTNTRQLADLIESRLDNVDADTRMFFHILDGKMLNLTTSVKWKTTWNEIKNQNRDWLSPVIYQIIMDNPKDPIKILLKKICEIPVDIESL